MVERQSQENVPPERIVVFLDVDKHLLPFDIPEEFFKSLGFGRLFQKRIAGHDTFAEWAESVGGGRRAKRKSQIRPAHDSSLNVLRSVVDASSKSVNPLTYKELYDFAFRLPLSPGARSFVEWCKQSPYVERVVLLSGSFQPFVDAIADRLCLSRKDAHGIPLQFRKARKGGQRVIAGVPRKTECKVETFKRLMRDQYRCPASRVFASDDGLTGRDWIEYVNRTGGIGIARNPAPAMILGRPVFSVVEKKFRLYRRLIGLQAKSRPSAVKKHLEELAKKRGRPMNRLLFAAGRPEVFSKRDISTEMKRLLKRSLARRQRDERIARAGIRTRRLAEGALSAAKKKIAALRPKCK